jgi:aromatic-L-amino-acid decarboxylase
MPPEEFLVHGRNILEWISEYLGSDGRYPVLARVRPGEVRAALPPSPPWEGEAFEHILRDFEEQVVPGLTHWNHPGFLAYFANTASSPAILGDLLATAVNANAMIWRTSPAATEVEGLTVDWLRQLLGLPGDFAGFINDTASHNSLYALAAARSQAFPEAGDQGLHSLPAGRIYASEHVHSSIDKAVVTLGLGRRGVRHLPADGSYRMKPEALRAAIGEDLAAGVRPVAVVAVAGTTSTASIDPLPEIADICREHGIWMHVDAAYAGVAAIVRELRPLLAGWERADSIVLNAHKWLFTPMDCALLYCRRPEALADAFSMVPPYLRTRESDEARDLMNYGVALGRSFRALKLWFVLRYFGGRGLAERLREHCLLAGRFAGWVQASDRWQLMASTLLGLVVFRYRDPGLGPDRTNLVNERILDAVNASGDVFLSHTVLDGRYVLRLSVGNLRTRREHVELAWQRLELEAARLG